MTAPRPFGHLVQAWAEWLQRHCDIKGHSVHLRYQCAESRVRALLGCATVERPTEGD